MNTNKAAEALFQLEQAKKSGEARRHEGVYGFHTVYNNGVVVWNDNNRNVHVQWTNKEGVHSYSF